MNNMIKIQRVILIGMLLLVTGCASTANKLRDDKLSQRDIRVSLVSSSVTGKKQGGGVLVKELIQYEIEGTDTSRPVTIVIQKQLIDDSMKTVENISRSVVVHEGINFSSYKFVVPAGSFIDKSFQLQTEFWIAGSKKLTVDQSFIPRELEKGE